MPNYYCKYCGTVASTINALTINLCLRYPSGSNKGHHVLYEGSEKSSYSCKYCGTNSSTIKALTNSLCTRHPNGQMKGNHEPAL